MKQLQLQSHQGRVINSFIIIARYRFTQYKRQILNRRLQRDTARQSKVSISNSA